MTDMQGPEIKKPVSVNIEDEMRGAYLDYAMSVIIGRALPSVKDGLKPVHRRALFAMYDLSNTYNKPYKKSARVVGDVIGKYHPHGDTAVYETIVRMAQDFSLRYPLIDGQGNFGSVDGDPPAAMRYTEIRMEKITDYLLADLDKETVDFQPNYDESLKEPIVFPARFPNLLVNGAAGIAVGMATNIPPHNLTEVVNACLALIENPELKTVDLFEYVKGPDFPTAGYLMGSSGFKQAYLTGKGVVVIRAKAEIEPFKNDRERIIVTELPYQVNKSRLIEKIADLVKDKEITEISDLRDESDREGMRIVIEVRKNENSNVLLNKLYKLTQLQDSFGISLLAIHNSQPKLFNLKDMIWAFVEHRKDVVLRRTAFELRKALAKAHILEGLKIAVENIDAVVEMVKKSKNPIEAKSKLMESFELSDIQAQAILDMRLQRLTGLERDKIVKDYDEVMKLIDDLKDILAKEHRVFEIIKEELVEIRDKFGDERRTKIEVDADTSFEVEDLIADEETLVTITHKGYIKRGDLDQFKAQKRGGKGIKGATTTEGDFVRSLYRTTTHSYLLCITNKGRLHWLKVYKIPQVSRTAKGKAIVNLLSLTPDERVVTILPVKEFDDKRFVIMVTEKGVIKKTALSEFSNIRKAGINAISIKEDDNLLAADITNSENDVFLCTTEGKCIRFPEENVRPMGRTARGVTGMSLSPNDQIVGMEVLSKQDDKGFEILTITEGGYGKRTKVEEYRLQSRGGKGIKAMNLTTRSGKVLAAKQVLPNDEVMVVSSKDKLIRISVSDISEQGRVTQGVRIMNVSGTDEKVVALEHLADV